MVHGMLHVQLQMPLILVEHRLLELAIDVTVTANTFFQQNEKNVTQGPDDSKPCQPLGLVLAMKEVMEWSTEV